MYLKFERLKSNYFLSVNNKMSNSPTPLHKKLKIAYFYALNNTYRSIAEKTLTSKTRVINGF